MSSDRERRLARALRDNLRRRKGADAPAEAGTRHADTRDGAPHGGDVSDPNAKRRSGA